VIWGGPEQETAAEVTVGITGGPEEDVAWGGHEQETAAEVTVGITGGLNDVIEWITGNLVQLFLESDSEKIIGLVGALPGTSVIYPTGWLTVSHELSYSSSNRWENCSFFSTENCTSVLIAKLTIDSESKSTPDSKITLDLSKSESNSASPELSASSALGEASCSSVLSLSVLLCCYFLFFCAVTSCWQTHPYTYIKHMPIQYEHKHAHTREIDKLISVLNNPLPSRSPKVLR